jgi:hypothetical protein
VRTVENSITFPKTSSYQALVEWAHPLYSTAGRMLYKVNCFTLKGNIIWRKIISFGQHIIQQVKAANLLPTNEKTPILLIS